MGCWFDRCVVGTLAAPVGGSSSHRCGLGGSCSILHHGFPEGGFHFWGIFGSVGCCMGGRDCHARQVGVGGCGQECGCHVVGGVCVVLGSMRLPLKVSHVVGSFVVGKYL